QRPGELLLLQALVPDDEPGAIPCQDLQLIAPTVDEHKQRPGERIALQRPFHQRRQPVHLLAHVDRRTMQLYPLNRAIRAQHRRPHPSSSRSHFGSGSRSISSCQPAACRSRHRIGAEPADSILTGTKADATTACRRFARLATNAALYSELTATPCAFAYCFSV